MTDDFDAVDFDAVDSVSVDSDSADLGFAPAISATGVDKSSPSAGRHESPSKDRPVSKWHRQARWRRRAAILVILFMATVGMGGIYGLVATSSSASDTAAAQNQIDAGQRIFNTTCVTCHGANLQGVTDRGPSLIGVGQAAAYFQVSTGRMPAIGQGPENDRKTNRYTEAETEALAAYVQSIGGGPVVPAGDLTKSTLPLSTGGELFRLNCAACHGATGKGAPLSAGKTAPGLNEATETQIYAAMLSGPESMPVFNDNQLTPDEKKVIVDYIKTLQTSKDPGGNGIDRIGPVSEGIVLWVIGVGALVLAILWIGAKA